MSKISCLMITSTDGNEWQPGLSVVSSCHALAGQGFPGNRESRPRIIAEEEKKVPDCPPTFRPPPSPNSDNEVYQEERHRRTPRTPPVVLSLAISVLACAVVDAVTDTASETLSGWSLVMLDMPLCPAPGPANYPPSPVSP